MAVLAVVLVALLAGGGAQPDPLAFTPARSAEYAQRAAAGEAHVLYARSPGGAVATAARVAALRPLIDRAARGSAVDPDLLEGIVFVESAGRPNAIVGGDPAAAAGLTQILPETGRDLLGMRIDVSASRRLTRRLAVALAAHRAGEAKRLAAERRRIDQRFDPSHALAATVRYLSIARSKLGRSDLSIVSYHMGIGNLQGVLSAFGASSTPGYAELYFASTPEHHVEAYRRLARFSDDSSLYYWRVLGARDVMRAYRSDRAGLARTAALQMAKASSENVLHPPAATPVFADPAALRSAYASGALTSLPSDPGGLGLRVDPSMGQLAGRIGAPASLYRGLRPGALRLLTYMAGRVRSLSGAKAPLTLTSTVRSADYQRLLARGDVEATHAYSLHTTGWAFDLGRSYSSPAQAAALQFELDRLQALNLIAWVREPRAIHVTVAGDAAALLHGR